MARFGTGSFCSPAEAICICDLSHIKVEVFWRSSSGHHINRRSVMETYEALPLETNYFPSQFAAGPIPRARYRQRFSSDVESVLVSASDRHRLRCIVDYGRSLSDLHGQDRKTKASPPPSDSCKL